VSGVQATIWTTCTHCRVETELPAADVTVLVYGEVVEWVWPCPGCGVGHWSTTDPQAHALLVASGATVLRPVGSPMTWDTLLGPPPDRPDAYPRRSLRARLANLVRRTPKGERWKR
jgi:hypothetical protein